MSETLDLLIVYSVLKKLTTPFEKWGAFKQGIIDKNGNVLKSRSELAREDKNDFTYLDIMVLNMKHLLGKIPGGSSKIGSYAAALLLMKEPAKINSESEEFLKELPALMEECYAEALICLEEDAVPANSMGAGAIQGAGVGPKGEPGFTPPMMNNYKRKNMLDAPKMINGVVDFKKLRRIMIGNMGGNAK